MEIKLWGDCFVKDVIKSINIMQKHDAGLQELEKCFERHGSIIKEAIKK